MENGNYKLYLDDLRDCPSGYVLARSSAEAIDILKEKGMPSLISFDHDLGNDEDTAMVFLKWLSANYDEVPAYFVHSANPIGALNIISYVESWKKSLLMSES